MTHNLAVDALNDMRGGTVDGLSFMVDQTLLFIKPGAVMTFDSRSALALMMVEWLEQGEHSRLESIQESRSIATWINSLS